MPKKLLTIILLLSLSACTMVKRQYGHDLSSKNHDASSLKSYHNVLDNMGAPDSVAVLNDSYIFAYHNVVIDEPQFGLNIPYYDLFKINLGVATAKHNYHFFAFDYEGNTINLSQFGWSNNLGSGSSLGFVFVVEETVDLSKFTIEKEASLWGKNLLLDKELAEFDLTDIVLGKRLDLHGQNF